MGATGAMGAVGATGAVGAVGGAIGAVGGATAEAEVKFPPPLMEGWSRVEEVRPPDTMEGVMLDMDAPRPREPTSGDCCRNEKTYS